MNPMPAVTEDRVASFENCLLGRHTRAPASMTANRDMTAVATSSQLQLKEPGCLTARLHKMEIKLKNTQ